MKKSTHQSPVGHSLRLAVLFVLSVLLLIILSLGVRAGIIIHESKYDPAHRFTVAAPSGKGSWVVYSFDRPSAEVSILHISGIPPGESVGRAAAILVDGTLPNERILTHGRYLSLLPELFFSPVSPGDITDYDIFRLAAMLQLTPPGNIKSDTVKLPADAQILRQTATTLFTDQAIVKESKSIHIVNATPVSGLGARLERVLSSSGANVIAIDTSGTQASRTSVTYSGKMSYTVSKLAAYLHVTAHKDESLGLSDILVILGKDVLSRRAF